MGVYFQRDNVRYYVQRVFQKKQCINLTEVLDFSDNLRVLIKKAAKAEEIRNKLIHSVWTSGGRFKTSIKTKKGVYTVFESYSDEELSQIAEMVDKIDTSIDAIKFDYIKYCYEKGINLNGVKHI